MSQITGGRKPNNRRMIVQVKQNPFGLWYKVGDLHEVGCYISLGYESGHPCFEKEKHGHGIHVDDVNIIEVLPIEKK